MSWLALPTLLLAAVGGQEVQQSPLYATAPEGSSVAISCRTRGALHGVYLEQSWPRAAHVVYYEDGKTPTVDRSLRGRIRFSGAQNNLTISMSFLTPNDSGVYTCNAVSESSVPGQGTMVVVTAKPSGGVCAHQETRLSCVALLAALAVGGLLLGLGLGLGTVGLLRARRTQVKKLSGAKNPACVVYEDMSYSHCSRQCR